MKMLLLTILISALLLRCIKPRESEDYLFEQGFDKIEIIGFGYDSCPNNNFYRTEFKATTPDGIDVSGTVCEDLLFDNKTISFK